MSENQLDQHYLAIRKRTIGELFDLTLVVMRNEGSRIFCWLMIFALPFALFNHAIATWFCEHNLLLDFEDGDWFFAYFCIVGALTAVQVPFASSFPIIYLGKRVFSRDEKPKRADIVIAWVEALPQLILFTMIFMPLIVFYECLPEIVALERSPLWTRKKGQVTTLRRLQNFHRGRFGEQLMMLVPIFLFGVFLAPSLTAVISYLFFLFVGPIPNYAVVFYAILIGAVFWTLILFLIVFHFLRYLDMRIEREGWDVELTFRAERSRMSE